MKMIQYTCRIAIIQKRNTVHSIAVIVNVLSMVVPWVEPCLDEPWSMRSCTMVSEPFCTMVEPWQSNHCWTMKGRIILLFFLVKQCMNRSWDDGWTMVHNGRTITSMIVPWYDHGEPCLDHSMASYGWIMVSWSVLSWNSYTYEFRQVTGSR